MNNAENAETILKRFVDCINVTGGVRRLETGDIAPAFDEDFLDLGLTYMEACDVLGVQPLFEDQ